MNLNTKTRLAELFTVMSQVMLSDVMLAQSAINSDLLISRAFDGLTVQLKTWMMKGPHPARKIYFLDGEACAPAMHFFDV